MNLTKDYLCYATKIGTACAPSTFPVSWGRKFFVAQVNKSCRWRTDYTNLSCVAQNIFHLTLISAPVVIIWCVE